MATTLGLIKTSKKAVKVRGAVSRQPKPSRSFNWARLVPVVSLFTFLLAATGIYYLAAALFSLPVTRVVVSGEYRYVNKQAITEEVIPFLEAGFVLLDLAGIREQLIQQAWVYDVEIVRHWPDEIVIAVKEQTPIARWGDSGYLNHRGELYVPENPVEINALPLLDGPDHETGRVMNYFRELNVALATAHLALTSLALNQRGSWSAQLTNGVQIEFGNGEVMEKMRRLLFAYDLGLSANFEKIKRIDMRYSNGFAVAWQQQKAS